MPATSHQRAPAKLTRSLRVTGVRADGYHLLDAEMVTLDLADSLHFADGDGLEVMACTSPGRAVVAGEDNLVLRALRAVGRRAQVRLEKRIPPGAGLGGGSADAAAVLRWAGVSDLGVAAQLGSDVPFCLVGGRARVTGVGEVVEPLAFEERSFVLALLPFGVSTARVYRAWDELGPGPPVEGGNDLEPAAVMAEARLAAWRDRLGELTGQVPHLAGSGSTWFLEGTLRSLGLEGGVEVEVDGQRARLVEARTARP